MSIRAKLYYKSSCPPCQWMSKLAVFLSLGSIRRIPISSEAARERYRDYPDKEGQLMLISGRQVTFGRMVFAAVPLCILQSWWRLLAHLFIFRNQQKTEL